MDWGLTKRQIILLVILLLAGLCLRLYHLERWFPDFFEEATPVLKARNFWGTENSGFDFNPHFFNYPALSFYLHFAFQALVGVAALILGKIGSLADFRHLLQNEIAWFVLGGRLLTVLFDLGTILAVFQLGKRLSGPSSGLLAAFFLSFNALHIRYSQYILVDVPLAFLVVVALLFILNVRQRGSTGDYAWAGLLIGLATSTKYTAALLAAPLLVATWPLLRIVDLTTFPFRGVDS